VEGAVDLAQVEGTAAASGPARPPAGAFSLGDDKALGVITLQDLHNLAGRAVLIYEFLVEVNLITRFKSGRVRRSSI
jgi:hypothetical protein